MDMYSVYLFIYLHFIYLFFNSTPCLQETTFRNFIRKFASVEGHMTLPFIRHLEPFRLSWRTHNSLLSNPSPLKFSPHLLICKFRGWHRRVLRLLSQWCLYMPRVLIIKLLNSAQTVCLCVSDASDNARCHWLPRINEPLSLCGARIEILCQIWMNLWPQSFEQANYQMCLTRNIPLRQLKHYIPAQ